MGLSNCNGEDDMLLKGDCRKLLWGLADCSVDSVVTDPPYELGFMGRSWDSSGIAYNQEVWAQCLRVLKPGGHLLAFGGSRTYHRLACAIEDAGFEIRDQIMWVYGSGFPKSLNVGKQEGCESWQGWGTALKPAHEPIVLARKPLDGTVANNVLTHGVGALNIDDSRVGTEIVEKGNAGRGLGHKDGTYQLGFGVSDTKQTSTGRWPANFIHDGSDEVLELFPDSKGGAYPAKRGQAVVTSFASGQETEGGYRAMGDSGSAARFFYCAKASRTERNTGLDHLQPQRHSDRPSDDLPGGDNPRNRTNTPQTNFHPTVKPLALIRYLITLITPPNGTVLDPFLGSGTTAVAATQLGFSWVGCELTADYWPIIEARVKHAE
jgi:DNA modification methylase